MHIKCQRTGTQVATSPGARRRWNKAYSRTAKTTRDAEDFLKSLKDILESTWTGRGGLQICRIKNTGGLVSMAGYVWKHGGWGGWYQQHIYSGWPLRSLLPDSCLRLDVWVGASQDTPPQRTRTSPIGQTRWSSKGCRREWGAPVAFAQPVCVALVEALSTIQGDSQFKQVVFV